MPAGPQGVSQDNSLKALICPRMPGLAGMVGLTGRLNFGQGTTLDNHFPNSRPKPSQLQNEGSNSIIASLPFKKAILVIININL